MPKHNPLNGAKKTLATLIHDLNRGGYGYSHTLLNEMEYLKKKLKLGGDTKATLKATLWAVERATELVVQTKASQAKLEAAKRIKVMVEEYDEAMLVQDAFDQVVGD